MTSTAAIMPPESSTPDETASISENDILFECPSCGKSLVVEESAEGMIIDCPQCETNVIVPPRSSAADPAAPSAPPAAEPPTPSTPSTEPAKPAPSHATTQPIPTLAEAPNVAKLHEEMTALATRIKEVQTQWADATNRIATRINDINRELVGLSRLEGSHKQALKDWNQLVGKLAQANEAVMKPAPQPPAKPS